MMVPGFPNFFVMYGPNTNLGHNSIIFMLECQARYIVQCVRHVMESGRPLEPRQDVFRAYNDRIQEELSETVWADVDQSWYKNAAGRIVNNWPLTTYRFWRETRRVDFSAFEGAG
jgi:cation diffusion facilitator CzcD-associated flavoprotein CzcO